MRRWLRRGVLATAGLLAVLVIGVLVAAVLVDGGESTEVTIDAPRSAVWKYASDSDNAVEWSVYFDHISAVRRPGLPQDGEVGSERICYRRADERGIRWSERVLDITPERHRRILTYDLVGFAAPSAADMTYTVDQHYVRIDNETTKLRFSTRLRRRDGIVNAVRYPFEKVAYEVVAAGETERIFRLNLENIGAAIEARERGGDVDVPHEYEPTNLLD